MENTIDTGAHRALLPADDRNVLRRLAARVAELASRPIEADKRDLWYRHNGLEHTRPVIFCDPENGWHEIIPGDALECRDDLARGWEFALRREIFWAEQIADDRVTMPHFVVGHAYAESDWGMRERRIGGQNGGAYTWEPPLADYDQMALLRYPTIEVDHAETARRLELARHTFGDLLPVRLRTSWWWTLGMTWTLVNLRGMERIMLDMVDRPAELHRLMAFLRDGHLARLDFLERAGLLFLNNDDSYVGSGGFGWTRALPAADFQGDVRPRDMWGFAESQETVGISPGMFEEFVLPYQIPLLERFGLNCYGCCEPLDARWRSVRLIPRLRRVSVSPWSNLAKMAENLQDGYVFSMKPNPSFLAMPVFDESAVRADLRASLQTTRDCCVEIVMKDCHTIANDPRRVVRWVQIAREEAEALH